MFSTVELTVEVDLDSNPSDPYRVYYYDGTSTLQNVDIDPDATPHYAVLQVKPNTVVQIESRSSGASSEAWQVNADALPGRGAKVQFTMPNEDSGMNIIRETFAAASTTGNTIGYLEGGMEDFTYEDFSFAT